MNQPVDPQNTREVNARVQELANSGLGRNAIAKRLGLTRYRVSKASEELGISFDRSTTSAATQARSVDAQAARAALSAQFQELAKLTLDKALDTLRADDLDPVELRELVWIAGSATASDVRLAKLALDAQQVKNTTQATDDLNTVVDAITTSITEIASISEDELEALLDEQDQAHELDGVDP